jgi:glycosyltransferase 2 family protein
MIKFLKKYWKFLLGVVISIFFIYIALRGQQLGEVWESTRSARFGWLIPAVAIYFLGVWMRAWRWHYMLRPLKKIPIRTMFPIVCIGYMGNNIYPARAGEVLRSVVLKRREDVPISASLATVVVERIFDGVVMLGFVFLNLPFIASQIGDANTIGWIQSLALWGGVAFAVILLVFLLAAMYPKIAERWINFFVDRLLPARWREKVYPIVSRFLSGLESLRSPRDALMVFFTSVLIWLLETCTYWLVMQAFDFQVSFFALMLMNGIVNLATIIPAAPGYVGTFDLPFITLLKAYNVPAEIASSFTLLLHATLWLPITLLGGYYFAREGLKWGTTEYRNTEEKTA